MKRAATLLLSLTAATGAPSATLTPGLWEFTNAPGTASLDGQALRDLPYTPPSAPERVCLTPAQAADPARWFARDSGADCTFTQADVKGGRVAIAGSCPPQFKGYDRGTVALSGRWTPTSYDLRFTTLTHGENGHMGFSGTMRGRRIGACTAH